MQSKKLILRFLFLALFLSLTFLFGCKKEARQIETTAIANKTSIEVNITKISEKEIPAVNNINICPDLILPSYMELDLRANDSIWIKYEYTNGIKFTDNYKLSVPVQLNCFEHSALYSCPEFKLTRVGIANVSVVENISFLKMNLTFSLYSFRNTSDPISGIPVKKAKLKLEYAQCQKFEAGKLG